MKKQIISISLIGFSILTTGCATILDGKTQTINLESSKEYKVSIDGENYTSPTTITMKRGEGDKVLRVKECNKDIPLKEGVNSSFFINILSGGFIGSTTDSSTGAMWEYDKENIQIECK
jgi:diacylglycerol kinase family enzyme